MIASLCLLAIAGAILVKGPRLAAAAWPHQAPRLAILTWQALTVSAVATLMLAGVTLLIPVTALADDVGTIVHACAMSIADAYGSSELLPGRIVGTVLAGVLPAWVLAAATRVLGRRWRQRRKLQRSLRLVTHWDPVTGAAVIDAAVPAAFCVPGRSPQTVITSAALDQLSAGELAGVLAHETAHLRGRHNLAIALAQVLATAFPHVRLFQLAAGRTRELIELLADDVATTQVDRINLASAIVRLAEMRAPSAAMAMAEDAAVLRVNRLLADRRPMEPWRHRVCSARALAVVAVPLLVAGYPALWAAISDLCWIP